MQPEATSFIYMTNVSIALATVGAIDQQVQTQIASFTQWEEFVQAGIEARQYKDRSQWLLGCLALGAEKKYGEDSIGKFAKTIGVRVGSLQTYRWVVKQYVEINPSFVPPDQVAFGILQSVASLPPEARTQLLERAEIDGMSIENARITVAKIKGRKLKPKYLVEFCEVHQKWQFVPQDIHEFESFHD